MWMIQNVGERVAVARAVAAYHTDNVDDQQGLDFAKKTIAALVERLPESTTGLSVYAHGEGSAVVTLQVESRNLTL